MSKFVFAFFVTAVLVTGAQAQPIQYSSKGSLASACIQTLSTNGYNAGRFVQPCSTVSSVHAIKALEVVATARQKIGDLLIEELVAIDKDLSVRCLRSLTKEGYLVASALARLCRTAEFEAGVATLELVTATRASLDVLVVTDLLRIKTALGTQCVDTLVKGGYPLLPNPLNIKPGLAHTNANVRAALLSGSRARICADLRYNGNAIHALRIITERRERISALNLDTLLTSIKTEAGVACINIFAKHGYPLNSSRRLEACGEMRSLNGLEALEALASGRHKITNETLSQLTQIP